MSGSPDKIETVYMCVAVQPGLDIHDPTNKVLVFALGKDCLNLLRVKDVDFDLLMMQSERDKSEYVMDCVSAGRGLDYANACEAWLESKGVDASAKRFSKRCSNSLPLRRINYLEYYILVCFVFEE
jgi:hypothetical protein